MTPSKKPSRPKLWLFSFAVGISFFGVLELGARWFFGDRLQSGLIAAPMAGNVNLEYPTYFRPHPALFWELVPSLNAPLSRWGDVINAEGLRMRRPTGSKRSRTRMACFGDSCTYGLGLAVDQAWPSLLDADPELDVINAAVPGYSSFQGARLAAIRCPEWKPDVVVIEFGINDANVWPSRDGNRIVALSDTDRAAYVRLRSVLNQSVLVGSLMNLVAAPKTETLQDFPRESFDGLTSRVACDQFRDNITAIAAHAPRAIVLIWPFKRVLDPSATHFVSPHRYAPYERAMASLQSSTVDVIDVGGLLRQHNLTASEAFLDDVHGTELMSHVVADEIRKHLR